MSISVRMKIYIIKKIILVRKPVTAEYIHTQYSQERTTTPFETTKNPLV